MALELLQSQTQVIALTPDLRGTSATAELRAPGGSLLATLTPALDPASSIVAAVGSSPDVLTLDTVGHLVVGREYWYESAKGWAAKVRLAEVNGLVVRLDVPPAGAPSVGDTLKGLRFTASVASSALVTRDRNYRIDWLVTTAGEVRAYRQVAHVVAMQFRPPVTPDDAKRLAVMSHRSWALSESFGTWLRIAEDATDRVRTLLTKDEDYPHWIGDQDAFRKAGEVACRLELAAMGRIPSGFDGSTFEADSERRLKDLVREAIGGVWVDRDESSSVTSNEVMGAHNVTIERV